MNQERFPFLDPIPSEINIRIAKARGSQIISPCALAIMDVLADKCCPRLGRLSAITISGIQGYWMQIPAKVWTDREIKACVKELIEDYEIPIGSSRGVPAGYYLIVTAEDRDAAERPLRNEIASLLKRLKTINPKAAYVQHLLGQSELSAASTPSDSQTVNE